jgi:HSP20 family protein
MSYWTLERTLSALDDLHRQMDRTLWATRQMPARSRLRDAWTGDRPALDGMVPPAELVETAEALTVRAELPGLTDKDFTITLDKDVLTLKGERKVIAPEGATVHRQERTGYSFTRSFALPCSVDGDKTSARLESGLLTVVLPKAASAQPRQISVKS